MNKTHDLDQVSGRGLASEIGFNAGEAAHPGIGTSARIVLLMIGLYALAVRVLFISHTMPYPTIGDEAYISEPALKILQSGDLNPGFFNYPSLSIYLTSLLQGAGLLAAKAAGQIESAAGVVSISYPHYDPALVMLIPRLGFTLLSVAGLLSLGLLGYRLTRLPAMLALPPALLVVSPSYLFLSWRYLNVDILGAVLVILALTYLIYTLEKSSLLHTAVLPGLFCGMIVASKYNLGLILVPFLLRIVLLRSGQRLYSSYILIAVTLLTFVLIVPYSVLDFGLFRANVKYEIHHYQTGHPGNEGQPGLPQLLHYLAKLRMEFGLPGFWLGLAGLVDLFRRRFRAALILTSFPFCLLLFMSGQKVHFIRNIISIYALYPVFIALGVVWSAGIAGRLINRSLGRGSLARAFRGPLDLAAVLLVSILLILGLPWTFIRASLAVPQDSRKAAVTWIEHNLENGARLIVAQELGMDLSDLEASYRIQGYPFLEYRPAQSDSGRSVFYIVPGFGFSDKYPAHRAVIESLQERFAPLERVASFGGRDVRVLEHPAVGPGNPRFFICRWPG